NLASRASRINFPQRNGVVLSQDTRSANPPRCSRARIRLRRNHERWRMPPKLYKPLHQSRLERGSATRSNFETPFAHPVNLVSTVSGIAAGRRPALRYIITLLALFSYFHSIYSQTLSLPPR